ncbi:MAG: hypothetical protein GF364_22475 [Candidatus Lokiarchaeota archaeon]|nr:hypothetical protein [Candidatus Lokiarchaeota archaeon]
MKKNYFLSYSFFFLFIFLNALQTELVLQEWVSYPAIIQGPENYLVDLVIIKFYTANSDIFLYGLLELSLVPMMFAIEKYVVQKKPILTIIGSAAIVLLIINLIINYAISQTVMVPFLLDFCIVYTFLAIIILVLGILYLYIKLIIQTSGDLKTQAILIVAGFIFQVVGLYLSNQYNVVGHLLAFGGIIILFFGVIKMK